MPEKLTYEFVKAQFEKEGYEIKDITILIKWRKMYNG